MRATWPVRATRPGRDRRAPRRCRDGETALCAWSHDARPGGAARIRNIPRAAASPETPAARSPARSFRAIRRKQLQRLGDIVLGPEPAVMPPPDRSRPMPDTPEVPGDPAAGPPDATGERRFGERVGPLNGKGDGEGKR